MKNKVLMSVSLAATIVLGAAVVNWANVPPPPVNQFLGFTDTTQQFPDKQGCLQASPCHVSDANAVNFHHNLTQPPRSLSCYGDPLTRPTTGCHQLVRDPATGQFVFVEFRDCLRCHTNQPHHISARAQDQNCKGCHGTVIDNPLDGHTIPTYAVSSVTPETKWRGNSLASPQNYGGCAACHQAALTATPKLFSNDATHHGTGIGFEPSVTGLSIKVGDCTWCHGGPQNVLDIRACERCHGIKSLHNIQANSENPTDLNPANIVPGGELLGYGHIGHDFDCWGCHGTVKKYDATQSGWSYTIPPASITGLSTTSLVGGKEAVLTITGSGFKTVYAATKTEVVSVNAQVVVKNAAVSLTLKPSSVTDSEIKVTVPALETGNYQLYVMKDDGYSNVAESNVTNINVHPALNIATASLGAGKTLTITGAGFGQAPPTDVKDGFGVYAADGSQSQIVFWSDGKIVATNQAFTAGSMATVKSLYGPTSKVVTNAGKKTRR